LESRSVHGREDVNTDAIDAALQGGRLEDVARQHDFGIPAAQRLLGIEYWNRLRKAAQKEESCVLDL